MTSQDPRPVALLGCGRLGSAILEGWLATGALKPRELVVLTRSAQPAADRAAGLGAALNPPPEALKSARALVLAVKPAAWAAALAPVVDSLAPDCVLVSVMAGVRSDRLGAAGGARPVARVMPTTAVAEARGVAAIWSADAGARALARDLFRQMADLVDLQIEEDLDAATAVAGSGPAYVHAFIRALAAAGEAAGLEPDSALRLARGAVRSAAAADPDQSLEAVIGRIASPGGTTEAGLNALTADGGFDQAVAAAVEAALAKARALAGD